eukprot:9503776-Pyramimonas_sp.AAC.1
MLRDGSDGRSETKLTSDLCNPSKPVLMRPFDEVGHLAREGVLAVRQPLSLESFDERVKAILSRGIPQGGAMGGDTLGVGLILQQGVGVHE